MFILKTHRLSIGFLCGVGLSLAINLGMPSVVCAASVAASAYYSDVEHDYSPDQRVCIFLSTFSRSSYDQRHTKQEKITYCDTLETNGKEGMISFLENLQQRAIRKRFDVLIRTYKNQPFYEYLQQAKKWIYQQSDSSRKIKKMTYDNCVNITDDIVLRLLEFASLPGLKGQNIEYIYNILDENAKKVSATARLMVGFSSVRKSEFGPKSHRLILDTQELYEKEISQFLDFIKNGYCEYKSKKSLRNNTLLLKDLKYFRRYEYTDFYRNVFDQEDGTAADIKQYDFIETNSSGNFAAIKNAHSAFKSFYGAFCRILVHLDEYIEMQEKTSDTGCEDSVSTAVVPTESTSIESTSTENVATENAKPKKKKPKKNKNKKASLVNEPQAQPETQHESKNELSQNGDVLEGVVESTSDTVMETLALDRLTLVNEAPDTVTETLALDSLTLVNEEPACAPLETDLCLPAQGAPLTIAQQDDPSISTQQDDPSISTQQDDPSISTLTETSVEKIETPPTTPISTPACEEVAPTLLSFEKNEDIGDVANAPSDNDSASLENLSLQDEQAVQTGAKLGGVEQEAEPEPMQDSVPPEHTMPSVESSNSHNNGYADNQQQGYYYNHQPIYNNQQQGYYYNQQSNYNNQQQGYWAANNQQPVYYSQQQWCYYNQQPGFWVTNQQPGFWVTNQQPGFWVTNQQPGFYTQQQGYPCVNPVNNDSLPTSNTNAVYCEETKNSAKLRDAPKATHGERASNNNSHNTKVKRKKQNTEAKSKEENTQANGKEENTQSNGKEEDTREKSNKRKEEMKRIKEKSEARWKRNICKLCYDAEQQGLNKPHHHRFW